VVHHGFPDSGICRSVFYFHTSGSTFIQELITPIKMAAAPSSASKKKQDPWPMMEEDMVRALNDLLIQHQKFSAMPSHTIVAENELEVTVHNAEEMMFDMRQAWDAVYQHPELFMITSEELNRRGALVRQWERDIQKPRDELKEVSKKRKNASQLSSAAKAAGVTADELAAAQGRRNVENSEYLQREYEAQQSTMADQDLAVDRIHDGVKRIKNNAELVQEELKKQETMLDDLERGMNQVQVKLEGAVKKVAKLLDQTSDKKKFICIGVLLFVLIILVYVLFS
jgi:syntaxin 6